MKKNIAIAILVFFLFIISYFVFIITHPFSYLKSLFTNSDDIRMVKQISMNYGNYDGDNLGELTERDGFSMYDGILFFPSNTTTISSGFGYRTHPYTKQRNVLHRGIDIPCPVGSEVYAVADGVVQPTNSEHHSYGKIVKIYHPELKLYSVYAHLSEPLVQIGDKVTRGDIVALSGNTGRSTGAHLHFEIRSQNNSPIDPMNFFTPTEESNKKEGSDNEFIK